MKEGKPYYKVKCDDEAKRLEIHNLLRDDNRLPQTTTRGKTSHHTPMEPDSPKIRTKTTILGHAHRSQRTHSSSLRNKREREILHVPTRMARTRHTRSRKTRKKHPNNHSLLDIWNK